MVIVKQPEPIVGTPDLYGGVPSLSTLDKAPMLALGALVLMLGLTLVARKKGARV